MPSNPVSSIWGVGPNAATKLQKLGIRTVSDLLLHVPRDYQDRKSRTLIRDIEDSECVVQGVIVDVSENAPNSRGLVVTFEDESGRAKMRLVHYGRSQRDQLVNKAWLYVYGKPSFARTFIHPQYRVFYDDPGEPEPEFRAVYPATAKLTSARIGAWIKQSLNQIAFFPKFEHDGQTLADAVTRIHEPLPEQHPELTDIARERVKFDEMLAYTLVSKRSAREGKTDNSLPLIRQTDLIDRFLDQLDFKLTNAQQRVIAEILADLENKSAVRRLLQGDVGSGKTVVAAIAVLCAADNQIQTAIMAPTELLAEQHHQVFSEWLEPLGIQVSLLTGRLPAKQRRKSQSDISEGKSLVAVGTHALFQEGTIFKNLGLAIIDEQHRFGVHQRMGLVHKGQHAHQLVLTATPIPRTLALAMFGDLSLSTLDELPPNRTPIHTTSHPSHRREYVLDAIERQLRAGQQVYWVCVSIDENEELDLAASTSTFEEFTERFHNIGVGHVNGRMKVKEKSDAMNKFRKGETRLLVATTVIEVGIDVPNATVMVIENPERLGLSQLHQLRGRVGRGDEQSYCLLLYQAPLSSNSEARLKAMRESTDGFKLADTDLKIRGMGQVLGARQSGMEHFRVASITDFLSRHRELNQVADQLLAEDPELADQIVSTWSSQEQGYVAT